MDFASILIIAGIVVLCAFPFLVRSFRSVDRRADDLEGRNPEVARAMREVRRDIDRGKGIYGP